MNTTEKGLLHVAGIIDLAEANMLIASGFEFLGFPLVLDHHKEDLGIKNASAIVAKFDNRSTFFLITYLSKASAIIDLCRQLGVGMVQLHGDVSVAELQHLRSATPALRIIKSLIVRDDNFKDLRDELARFAPLVDAFITDTFDPLTGARGATGKTHDWDISRKIVEISPVPVILAGGLNADNVRTAIAAVHPAGVDVHTGIEAEDGRKSPDLSRRFVSEACAAFAASP
jgi:phosphoribosylanthranilate isomerase